MPFYFILFEIINNIGLLFILYDLYINLNIYLCRITKYFTSLHLHNTLIIT